MINFSGIALAAINIDGIWELEDTVDAGSCFGQQGIYGSQTYTYQATITTARNGLVTIQHGDQSLTWSRTLDQLSLYYNDNIFLFSEYVGAISIKEGVLLGSSSLRLGQDQGTCMVNTVIKGRLLTAFAPPKPIPDGAYSQSGMLLAFGSFQEPNDQPASATPLLINDQPLEQTFTQNDEDWYDFYAKQGLSYTIDIPTLSVGKFVNPGFEIYDAQGQLLVSQIDQGAIGEGENLVWVAPASGLFRLKVFNRAASSVIPKAISGAKDFAYDVRVYLTDAPQSGIAKGFVLDNCNQAGVEGAEVSAILGQDVIVDSTFSFKTGEYGLVLNPADYALVGRAENYLENALAVKVEADNISLNQFNLQSSQVCAERDLKIDPLILEQRAVSVYKPDSKQLIVRDVVAGGQAYYVELREEGDYRFVITRIFSIPSVIHSPPGLYNFETGIADLPSVFAFNQSWYVRFRNDNGVFALLDFRPN